MYNELLLSFEGHSGEQWRMLRKEKFEAPSGKACHDLHHFSSDIFHENSFSIFKTAFDFFPPLQYCLEISKSLVKEKHF